MKEMRAARDDLDTPVSEGWVKRDDQSRRAESPPDLGAVGLQPTRRKHCIGHSAGACDLEAARTKSRKDPLSPRLGLSKC
jgi:hypothetical protein